MTAPSRSRRSQARPRASSARRSSSTGFARYALGEGIEKEEHGFRGRGRCRRRHHRLIWHYPRQWPKAAHRAAFCKERMAAPNRGQPKDGETLMRPQRVLVKLFGEALAGPVGNGLDGATLTALAADIAHASHEGVEIGIVVGGGNFFRGVQGLNKGLDRTTADSIGMLGTVMNALALEHAIEAAGAPARAMSAVPMPSLCESYARKRALDHLSNGKVVILGGGTGNPISQPIRARRSARPSSAAAICSRRRRSTASIATIRRRTRPRPATARSPRGCDQARPQGDGHRQPLRWRGMRASPLSFSPSPNPARSRPSCAARAGRPM